MKKPNKRHWAFISEGAGAGKSTLLASSARAPLMVVDTDGRFDAVEELVGGEVLYASQIRNIRELAEELLNTFDQRAYKSLAWDSLTKLHSIHTRLPWMRAREGLVKNKASAMIDKSNAMTMARDLGAVLGVDSYYVWHTTAGVDGAGKLEIRDMISSTERNRLMTSINVILQCVVKNGNYGVEVVQARDFGGRKANTGFTIWDHPGNYWRGTADYLERLMYTSFMSADEACKWAIEELGRGEIGEMRGEYDHLKETLQPETAASMWVAWIQHIDEVNTARVENEVESVDFQPGEAKVALPERPAGTTESEYVHADGSANHVPAGGDDLPNVVPGEGTVAEIIDSIAVLRKSLAEHEQLSLGHVVFAVAEARPDLGRPDELLKALEAFDGLPDGYNIAMDQRVTLGGGETFYDWLVDLKALPEVE